jgi:hypothetical protein
MSIEQGIDPDKAVGLANIVKQAYINASPQMTMGEWVMKMFYPDIFIETLKSGRDFYCAQRTSDARSYLIGMLVTGSLSASPLQNPLNYTKKP